MTYMPVCVHIYIYYNILYIFNLFGYGFLANNVKQMCIDKSFILSKTIAVSTEMQH